MDDDGPVRRLIHQMLECHGHDVVEVAHGGEAVEVYEREQDGGIGFDVVILDLTVPGGMGGKEALEHLREIDPAVCAVVASGYSHDPVLAEHERFGFVGRIAKPFSRDELARVVDEAIARRRRTQKGQLA